MPGSPLAALQENPTVSRYGGVLVVAVIPLERRQYLGGILEQNSTPLYTGAKGRGHRGILEAFRSAGAGDSEGNCWVSAVSCIERTVPPWGVICAKLDSAEMSTAEPYS